MRERKIKVAFVGRYGEAEVCSGAEKTARQILNEHNKKHEGIFIQYFFDGRKYGVLKKLFGKKDEGIVFTCGLLRVYGMLRDFRPDIIHIVTFERFALICFLYKFFNGTKIIYTVHGVVVYENVIKSLSFFYRVKDKIAEKIFIGKSDRLISVSGQLINKLSEYYKIDDMKFAVVANPVEDIFCRAVHKEIFIRPLKAVIIYRNFFHHSGWEFFKLCFMSYKPDIEIHVISSEGFKGPENMKISVSSVMSGPDLVEFYRDKDIFLSLNKYDTFSVSTAEAMACGLIPVVTEETGISRYIENGYNGYVVKYGDCQLLNEIIEKLINSDDSTLTGLSMKASEIYSDLSSDKVYNCYENIYSEVLK